VKAIKPKHVEVN